MTTRTFCRLKDKKQVLKISLHCPFNQRKRRMVPWWFWSLKQFYNIAVLHGGGVYNTSPEEVVQKLNGGEGKEDVKTIVVK